jgi:transposase
MTTTTEEETLILKTDVLGRVRMPKDRREAILDAFERSGMSGEAFAERIGVKYPTFATWVQKRRRNRGAYKGKAGKLVKAAPITLFEAVVETGASPSAGTTLEVETAQGLKLHIHSSSDVALAAELLRTLSEAKGC